jgi:hypothetical protein
MKWPLFVSLTTKNFTDGSHGIREVRRAFGKLRRLRWFRRAVTGGIAAVEVTNRGKGWHAHVHGLFDCRWFGVTTSPPPSHWTREQKHAHAKKTATEVREQWELCTGRKSRQLKVRRVWARDDGDIRPALAEVLKYSVTAEALLDIEEPLSPLLDVMTATRLVTSWGNCYRLGVTRDKRSQCPCDNCHSMDAWLPEVIADAMCRKK